MSARSQLAVLLRLLVKGTCSELQKVDFPAYENAERPGWDGEVEVKSASLNVPAGKSGWEFSCTKNPLPKANGDYEARSSSVPKHVRRSMTFVFVTPRNWRGKKKWETSKRKECNWKQVIAYDASDLEQWIENSLAAQIWFSEQIRKPIEGYRSLEKCWDDWATVTDPHLSSALFQSTIETHQAKFVNWTKSDPSAPFVIAADSRDESLAILCCLIEEQREECVFGTHNTIILDSGEAVSRVLSVTSNELLIVAANSKVEKAMASYYGDLHCAIVTTKNSPFGKPDIIQHPLSNSDFYNALEKMGVDRIMIPRIARESGRSPIILRRQLAQGDSVKQPRWIKEWSLVMKLIPAALVGSWSESCEGDCCILASIASAKYSNVEDAVATLMSLEEAPVWSIDKYRGVASRMECLFSVAPAMTRTKLTQYFSSTERVLTTDIVAHKSPASIEEFHGTLDESSVYSRELKSGMCETLVLFAIYGNMLFGERLGVDVRGCVSNSVRNIISKFEVDVLHSLSRDLPKLAEAAPNVFLEHVERDLNGEKKVLFQLFEPEYPFWHAGYCPRLSILNSFECLAWNPDYFTRVVMILAKLSELATDDTSSNNPQNSLKSLFRSWIPQTAASIEMRIQVLERLVECHPTVAWKLCISELNLGFDVGQHNYRPLWRPVVSNAGNADETSEPARFVKKCIDICLNWSSQTEFTLAEVFERLHALPKPAKNFTDRVLNLISDWVRTSPENEAKAYLRERIRRHTRSRMNDNVAMHEEFIEQATSAMNLLIVDDPIVRNKWLFEASEWDDVSEDFDEKEVDRSDRYLKIRTRRTLALKEIWKASNFHGLMRVLEFSEKKTFVGAAMFDILESMEQRIDFVSCCLKYVDTVHESSIKECLLGFFENRKAAFTSKVARRVKRKNSSNQSVMLFTCMPFQQSTWRAMEEYHQDNLFSCKSICRFNFWLLVNNSQTVCNAYWKLVKPVPRTVTDSDANVVVDRLLNVNRPIAALFSVQYLLGNVETKHLVRMLQLMPVTIYGQPKRIQTDEHLISLVFETLEMKSDITIDEKINLELLHFRSIEKSENGTPNLCKKFTSSPTFYAETICENYTTRSTAVKHMKFESEDQERTELSRSRFMALWRLRRVPGAGEEGIIDVDFLMNWIGEVQEHCKLHCCTEYADTLIGELLSRSQPDQDGTWPSQAICMVLEAFSSREIGNGFMTGINNARGVVWRKEWGGQERDLAAKWKKSADEVRPKFPYVANVLESVSKSYEDDAQRYDVDEIVKRRVDI